jgi:hypothetical protein
MAGERDLAALLRDMKPEMHEGIFVFCTITEDAKLPAGITPLLTFREAEGTTLVIPKGEAERIGLSHQFPSRLITLTVHSSLEAGRLAGGDHRPPRWSRHQRERGVGVLPRSSVCARKPG